MSPMPRKSEELHELEGTKPHYASPKTVESYLKPSRPKYPKELPKPARKMFKDLCRLLEERRVLTSGDFEAIRLYCNLHQRLARAQEHLDAEGEICQYTQLDKDGVQIVVYRQNLWLKIAVKCESQMLAILVQLGLTPKAKDHVRPTKSAVEPEKSFEDTYLARRPRSKPSIVSIRPVLPSEMLASDEESDEPQTGSEA
jgi:P27 family predicted phage terminase small subunit